MREFDVITFDCYGTLIDWESGIRSAFAAAGVDGDDALRTYPIDLTARFRWVNDTRFKPYIGLGARYVAAPHVDSMFGYTNRTTPELVGGVVYQLRHLGIVADGKVLLGDHEYYDSMFKTSIGLSWRF